MTTTPMPASLELTLREAHEHLSRAADLLAYAVTGPTCAGDSSVGDAPKIEQWWVATDFFAKDGDKVLGPFGSRDLALIVRSYIEKASRRDDLCVDSEPTS